MTYEGVRITLGMTRESVVSRLGDRVTLEHIETSEKGMTFWLHKRSSKSVIGHLRFRDDHLTSASQLFDFGNSQFDFGALLYKVLREMASDGELSAKISLSKSKDMDGWSITIVAPEGQVQVLMVDTSDGRSANIQKDILAQ